MARQAVIDVVEEVLHGGFDIMPIKGVNSNDEVPADATAFLVVQYPVADERRITFGDPGNNLYREDGVARFVLNLERGSGTRQGNLWAEQIAALYRGKVISGVRFGAVASPVIDDRNEEGAFFSLAVAVPYEHDAVG